MAKSQRISESKGLRTGTKKSRTGCRTCRTRRIKCDETPSSCTNCSSTGRACGYDLQRLPRSTKVTTPQEITDGLRWAITSDERRCYSHFQIHTIPTLSGFFDSPLWQALILQMSVSEPAVYHAVVALSAVHQDSEMHGMPLPGQDLQNEWNRFALDQCGRSFALLSHRQSSQDPRLREVILLCCLLFVLTQLLRGQYDDAFQHLQSGLRILNETKAHLSERAIEPSIVTAFADLEVQSLQFGVCGDFSPDDELVPETSTNDMETFHSLPDARRALGSLLGPAYRFLVQCAGLSEEEILLNYGSLHQTQLQLFSQFSGFGYCLESFCSCSKLNRKEQRGADMIRLVHRSVSLPLKTALLRDETTLAYYTPEYETLLSMVEEITEMFPERPTVTLDMGILPPLYAAAMWCRDYTVRRRAIAALQSWPHREGSFDSNWVVFTALEQIKAESMTEPEQNVTTAASSQPSHVEKGRWSGLKYSGFSLDGALSSTRSMKSWPCVRAIQQAKANKGNEYDHSSNLISNTENK
ncbi:hypothetical protein BDW59DRAFT_180875 [Aspergillus cavernicola]|uniref:Zn(2)-C6 fungal-type domain-containing protein n=1 Tax=Aspergillus cavernicola TaxID=176166 RepID=A0ABR4I3J5_9EURO